MSDRKIWNLTPHAINYDDGQIRRTIESDGVARIHQSSRPAAKIHDMTTVYTVYGGVDNVPADVMPGDIVIVSTLAADAVQKAFPHIMVLVPDTGPTCRRDDSGRIISICQFIRI